MFTELHLARRGVISRVLTPLDLPAPAPLPGREAGVALRPQPLVMGAVPRRGAGCDRAFILHEPARIEEGA